MPGKHQYRPKQLLTVNEIVRRYNLKKEDEVKIIRALMNNSIPYKEVNDGLLLHVRDVEQLLNAPWAPTRKYVIVFPQLHMN
jgi:hypothetical protein